MPFEIVRNDITRVRADAIVNTANPDPVIGAGTDAAIHRAAGKQLLEARKKIGTIDPGCAAITPAYRLPARYVIHTVGPVWQGGNSGEQELLRRCYRNALDLAMEFGCESIAFPLLSAGFYGFPNDLALQIAREEFSEFLLHHEMTVTLVVFSREAFRLSESLHRNIKSYIDEHYVAEVLREDRETLYSCRESICLSQDEAPRAQRLSRRRNPAEASPFPAPAPKHSTSARETLENILNHTDAGFSETLLGLIDKTGKKDSEIYKKANITKQHFSKIRNNPHYKPTKATAVAFALALELDLEQTNDLIGRAGYVLTGSSKFDLIIMYFIRERNYNVVDINMALYEFDQSLLGA